MRLSCVFYKFFLDGEGLCFELGLNDIGVLNGVWFCKLIIILLYKVNVNWVVIIRFL